MYAGIEGEFNSLLPDRLDAANMNGEAYTGSFSYHLSVIILVASMSQNKPFTQLDVFLLILYFYRFFESICGGAWGFSFANGTINRSFALIAHQSTKVGMRK